MKTFLFSLLIIFSLQASAACLIHNERQMELSDIRLEQVSAWTHCSYEDARLYSSSFDVELNAIETLIDIGSYQRAHHQPRIEQLKKNKAVMIQTLYPVNEGGNARQALLRVESTYFDSGLGKDISFSGVGNLIAVVQELPDRRQTPLNQKTKYYVLTAGHLVKGNDLKIINSRGELLSLGRVYLDDANDLAAIELSTDPQTQPLAYWGLKNRRQKLATYLEDINSSSTSTRDRFSGLSYPLSILESLEHFRYSPYPAFLIGRSLERDLNQVSVLPRDKKTSSFQMNWHLPSGLSGSAIIGDQKDEFLSLIGIVTISTVTEASGSLSTVAGSKAILHLLTQSLKAEDVSVDAQWFFISGTAVRVMPNSVEIFVQQKPIGNGIYVNGITKNEELGKNNQALQKIKDKKMEEILKKHIKPSQKMDLQKIQLEIPDKKIIIR